MTKKKLTYNESSWKNLTNAMTGFLRDVIISSGTLESLQTSPGHQTFPHLTQTTSPSLNDEDSDDMVPHLLDLQNMQI